MSEDSSNPQIVFTTQQIIKMLPHRYPFLLVDRIVYLNVEENKVIGQKNVTMNEPFFQGHFPGAPIMPGVLILEALAQTGGILVHEKGFGHKIALLLHMEQVKFRKPVVPGDVLLLEAIGLHLSSKAGKVSAKARVRDVVVAEAQIAYALMDREQLV